MDIDGAIEWLEIIKDGFHYKDLQSAIKIEGYEDCEKAIETIINEYNNLKQIEEAHRRQALKVLKDYCIGRECKNCYFYEENSDSNCGLRYRNPIENYNKYVKEE